MTKKIIKKAVIKKPVIIEKKRGVQVGTKRQPYKTKNKITSLELQQNEITKTEIKKDLQNDSIDNITIEDKKEISENVESIHEQKFNNFLSDNGKDFDENDYKNEVAEIKTETKPEDLETEKKEFDFTGVQNSQNGNVNLNAMKDSQKVLINGMLLLSICDFIFPALIKFIYKYIDTNAKKVDVSKTKLDNEQRQSLKEVADYASAYIFEKVNPMIIFLIGMGAMYYTNFTGELSKVEKTKKIEKPKEDFSSLTDLLTDENQTEFKKEILNPKKKK